MVGDFGVDVTKAIERVTSYLAKQDSVFSSAVVEKKLTIWLSLMNGTCVRVPSILQ